MWLDALYNDDGVVLLLKIVLMYILLTKAMTLSWSICCLNTLSNFTFKYTLSKLHLKHFTVLRFI